MSLKREISFLVSQVLLEIRSNFKWPEFKKIDGLTNKAIYLHKTGTEILGEGSARIVYLLSSRYVLKLAQPSSAARGIAQNKYEAELATDPEIQPIVADVYDMADDYSWLVSELVRPLDNVDEFERLAGVPFIPLMKVVDVIFDNQLDNTIERIQTARLKWFDRLKEFEPGDPEHRDEIKLILRNIHHLEEELEIFTEIPKHPFAQAVIELITKKGSMSADMRALDHWGKTADGRVVLLDYGYSKEIARELYDVSWV